MQFLSRSRLVLSATLAFALVCLGTTDAQEQSFLIDVGSTQQTFDATTSWNNLLTATGTSDTGLLPGLIATDGTSTSINLQMVARFNGENLNGTTVSSRFPSSATSDSLFGNTEIFNNLTNIFPKFKFTNLNPAKRYNFTFYASRTGVTDVRETGYTVTGGISGSATLNVANNVDNIAQVFSITPDSFGEILVSLAPTAANNNANHFTYLGAMRMDVIPEPSAALMIGSGVAMLAVVRRRRA